MEQQDSVSWKAIVAAFKQNGHYEETVVHFNERLCFGMEPDDFIYDSVFKACAALQSLEFGLLVHDSSDAFVASTVVDMYCKRGKWVDVSTFKDKKANEAGRHKKEPGCSWIEVQSEMHGSLVGYNVHLRSRELYDMLNYLIDEMKLSENEPDLAYFSDVAEEGSAFEQDQLELLVANISCIGVPIYYLTKLWI
ncbi:hypothetical protein QYE76_012351 [Lolium multiflorum]|uniref:Pentatricopeptide repeat-containing protein n=1 Tax=Lolium multiflorum TaxID=4521 RepID=A0AAD8U1P4_LOLMU|nr:hypothetical protein QYE76_012351 [Lolium multiflorum]